MWRIHASLVCCGFDLKSNSQKLISMYARLGDLDGALSVFRSLPHPETSTWNLILRAHVDSGLFETALSLYSSMRESSVRPDHFTFPLLNRAISCLHGCLELGETIHCLGIQMGFGMDPYFCNTMIEMYARYDRINAARLLFDEMRSRDVVSWTSMISGYARVGNTFGSLRLFHEMQGAGFEPNSVTLVVMLQACCVKEDAALGRQLYGFAIKRGLENSESVQNSVLMVFSKAGRLEEAEKIFDRIDNRGVVSWNIMISMYSSAGDVSRVTDCFDKMRVEVTPSRETLTLVISAFAKSSGILRGQKIHGHAVKSGQIDAVMQASLVDFYAKCGELETSVYLFEEVREKNKMTWSTMLSGFIQNGRFNEAVDLFRRMQIAGFDQVPDTPRGILLACAHLGALRSGKEVHGHLIRNGFSGHGDDEYLETSLLSMYAKCGSIILARKCFDHIVVKDVVVWSSMIEGYAIHGIGSEALRLFDQMEEEGVKPNGVTFLSLLSACGHSGLVSEGCDIFRSMTGAFGIEPELNHFTCMVDLLGRAAKLQEALGVISNMAAEPDGRIWGALLASCRIHSDTKLGGYAAQKLFDLEPDNVGYHVVLCNIHGSGERWDEAENLRKVMGEKDLRKRPGWSCVDVRGRMHTFVVGDHRSHPQAGEIHEILGCLNRKIEEAEWRMPIEKLI